MIRDNPFIANCESFSFSILFDHFNEKKKRVKFIHGLLKYAKWEKDINLFEYVLPIHKLRKNPKTYFVFDASNEGFSPFEYHFFDVLYRSCRKSKVPPHKVIFISSNLKDKHNLKIYNELHGIKNSIKVFPYCNFKFAIQNLIEDAYGFNFSSDKAYDYFYLQCQDKFINSYGLSLSRVNRPHRSLAHYLLYEFKLDKFFDISQDSLTINEVCNLQKKFNLNKGILEWRETLPKTIDTDDFATNYAIFVNSHLHNSTLFQIVNETEVDDKNGSSLFFSEKTFRAMAHMQPFIVFGQPNCNWYLKKLGFMLFEDDFDYSFDNISDVKERYIAICHTVKSCIDRLSKMSRQEQIDWRFSREKILKHNFELVMNTDFYKKDFKRLIKSL